MVGDKEITVDGFNNILKGNTVIKWTLGLWRLIMMKKTEVYTEDELRDYKELVERTNFIKFSHITKSSDRPTSTTKYNFLEELFKGGLESERKKGSDKEEQSEEKEKEGTGFQFLPGDIFFLNFVLAKSLQPKLK